MEFGEHVLVFVHFLGLAALIGGAFVQITASDKVVNRAMLDGALTQLVTGIALVGVIQGALDEEVNNAKVGLKLAILLVIIGLSWVNRKKPSIPTGIWATILGLAVVNVGIAVFW
jgi:hypothetical protein